MKTTAMKQKGTGLSGKKSSFSQKARVFKKEFRRDWQLHLIILIPILHLLLFSYGPMYGAQIAFRDFNIRQGIMGSEWVGLKWFEKFFTSYNFKQIVWNTVAISLYDILMGFPLPIIFALLLNTMRHERYKKVIQSVAYMPHFISVVVLVSIVNTVFNPVGGVYGSLYKLFGGIGIPSDFRGKASVFRHLYVWSGIWQNLGWNTIIYTAALGGVSPELHEAAQIDGATRLQRIFHVDIPAILPTICIMLILRFGSVMGVGFEKVYLMQNNLNLSVSEVISTHVYKVGMGNASDFSYGAAIGLFNSVINCAFLILVNVITRKLSSDEVGLF